MAQVWIRTYTIIRADMFAWRIILYQMEKMNTYGWRLFVLSYILIWLIIFNHTQQKKRWLCFAVTGWRFGYLTGIWTDTIDFTSLDFPHFTILAPLIYIR